MSHKETAVRLERLPVEAYRHKDSLRYSDTNGLYGLFDALFGKTSVVLLGPAGVGKSLAVASWAEQHNIPMVTVDCSEDLRANRLLGAYTLRGAETPFILGPIPTAFEIANEVGKCILNFEEISALSPQAQKLLNPIMDFRCRIEVSEAGKVFALEPGKILWVIGSMNTAGYGGTFQLNEDLLSRMELVVLDYPEPEHEKQIIKQILPSEVFATLSRSEGKAKASVIDGMLTLARETRQRTAGLEYTLSPRDVVRALLNVSYVGLTPALQLLLGKYDGEARATIKARITSIFTGVTLPSLPEDRLLKDARS